MTSTIEKGSIVLITGVNGFIGSHIADQLLAAGYNVRGTSRSVDKSQWLYELFDKKYGRGRFEAVAVPDMVADGAFDDAVKGVRGIVHVASILTFSDKVEDVVPPTVKGTLEVLRSAVKEPGVKSLVYTSSSSACLMPTDAIGKKVVVTEDNWNESAIEEARKNPTASPFVVYAASKAEAERALWREVQRTKPNFQVATVLPDANFGPILKPGGANSSSSATWLYKFTQGDKSFLEFPPHWAINVVDDARLHVAALLDPACHGKRIFAFAERYNWNRILAILRKQNPEREFLEDGPDQGQSLSEIVPIEAAEALLRKHYQKGFTGLEETIKENTEGWFD
ncbi:NAD-P-binding protein [Mycena polygramma]|nr:NAD-P-binding protein [Mycena polygramma]